MLELREHPARVVLLGQELVDELGADLLASHGLLLKGYHLAPVEPATRRLEADIYVLGARRPLEVFFAFLDHSGCAAPAQARGRRQPRPPPQT